MITRCYEFEIFQEDGFYVALPYDLGGGTQGENFDDLCDMVADWLRATLEDYDMKGEEPPRPTYGNEPRHGGSNMLVEVSAGRETVEKVSASEAARLLAVTPSRVTQMLASNLLEGWRDGRNTWVTLDSVNARLADERRAGRPHKAPAKV